jgi:hypothetical protein
MGIEVGSFAHNVDCASNHCRVVTGQWFDLPPKWRSVAYVSLVLDSVDFSMAEREIVSLLRKSGSG